MLLLRGMNPSDGEISLGASKTSLIRLTQALEQFINTALQTGFPLPALTNTCARKVCSFLL